LDTTSKKNIEMFYFFRTTGPACAVHVSHMGMRTVEDACGCSTRRLTERKYVRGRMLVVVVAQCGFGHSASVLPGLTAMRSVLYMYSSLLCTHACTYQYACVFGDYVSFCTKLGEEGSCKAPSISPLSIHAQGSQIQRYRRC
jgi:hypothetical protein